MAADRCNQTPRASKRDRRNHTGEIAGKEVERVMIEHRQNPAKAYLMRYRGLKAKCNALERAIRAAKKSVCRQAAAGK